MPSHIFGRTIAVVAAAVLMTGGLVAADALTQLGLTPAAAKEALMAGIGSGWLNYSLAAPAFRAAPEALRVELAGGAIQWAKVYTASPDFQASYAKLREIRKPSAPVFTGTPEEEFARERERQATERAQGAEEMKKAMASMPPDQRKQMEEAIKQAADVMKQMDTPEMRKMMIDGLRMQREQRTRDYQQELSRWKDDYPESPAPLIARRITAFLDTSADVDFDAVLLQKNGKMRFVKDAYESKPSEWKLCYRAGKAPVAAARAAAQAWLKELGH